MMTRPSLTGPRDLLALLLCCAAGCSSTNLGAPMEDAPSGSVQAKKELEEGDGGAPTSGGPPPGHPSRSARPKDAVSPPAAPDRFVQALDEEADQRGGDDEATATRSWFPESFLFQPLVVTDDQGQAQVSVTVPDRLTTWRVLGLAHSQDGGLAGDVTQFVGTLPVYVDPVVPPFLRAGDVVSLPIQVVNTSQSAITAPLTLSASGAASLQTQRRVTVPAGSSRVSWVPLSTPRAGPITLRAAIGRTDAVERSFEVQPAGRLVEQSRGGTLAAARQITLTVPDDLDADSARVRLLVYPGALAVLRNELDGAIARDGVAATAYALLLAGQAPALLETLGASIQGDAPDATPAPDSPAGRLRALGILATQRAIGLARSPDTETAALLAQAALSHPDNPILVRMGDRLIDTLVRAQRPDGTFGGEGGGWTLQRLLVATADGVRAVDAAAAVPTGEPYERGARKRDAQAVRLRASNAFERYAVTGGAGASAVDDPYTAASILSANAVSGDAQRALRERVRGAITTTADGARALEPPADVLRADGTPPSAAEATALAILALRDDPEAQALLPDLGATVLSSYQPTRGWGDGRANLACLQALLLVFDTPLPETVHVLLEMDGRVISEDTLDHDALTQIAVLDAPLLQGDGAPELRGDHTWTVRAQPAVPGLGFALSVQTWVPWRVATSERGLELQVSTPSALRVGQTATQRVRAAAPAHTALTIEQRLPAGVQVDEQSLQALVDNGDLNGFEAANGLIRLNVNPLDPGETLAVDYRVVPTLSGRLSSGASAIWPAGREDLAFQIPPTTWRIE